MRVPAREPCRGEKDLAFRACRSRPRGGGAERPSVALERASSTCSRSRTGGLVEGRAPVQRDDGRRGHAAARVPRDPPRRRDRTLAPPGSAPGSAPTAPGPTSTAVPGTSPPRSRPTGRCAWPATPPRSPHMRAAAAFIRARGVSSRRASSRTSGSRCSASGRGSASRRCRRRSSCCPRWVPLNIYDFACWARQTIVALSIVIATAPCTRCPSTWTSCTRPRGASPAMRTPSARLAGDGWLRPARPRPLRAVRAPAAAPLRRLALGARRALDRAPPGGGRLLGRHPAPVGLLADGPPPERLPTRARRHAARHRRAGRLHAGGSRRPPSAHRRLDAWPASRPSGTPPWRSSRSPTPACPTSIPRSCGPARGCSTRRSTDAATGRPRAPIYRPAAGPSSSPTTTTPTSTTPRRSSWPCSGARTRPTRTRVREAARRAAVLGRRHAEPRRRLGRVRRRQHALAHPRTAVPGLRRGDRRAQRRRHRPRARDARGARPRDSPRRPRGLAGCSPSRSSTAPGSAAGASTTSMGRAPPCPRWSPAASSPPRPCDPPRRELARGAPERGRRLGRGPALLR